MSYAKQHAEWMSLVEVSGPFLTLSVLNSVLKHGLDAHDPDLYRTVKEAYGEWEETCDAAIHTLWARFLLQAVLGYPTEVLVEGTALPESLSYTEPNHGERVAPTLAVVDPDTFKPLLPVLVAPRGQKLDSPLAGSRWPASPHTRMQLLLQGSGLQAGFVTNGAQWSLVHVRKGEPTGFATWQTVLLTEEPITLRAFRDLLGVARTLGAPAGETLFDMLDKSAVDAEEVTKELGRQVRLAVEVFINALERLDRARNRELLKGATTEEVYRAALTVMMRLVFMLSAEERGLFSLGDVWERHYAVSTLNDQLKEEKDESVLEHGFDAWRRLLATFRLIHGGCPHEDLRIPAYGGSLFDPAKYPFLEEATVDNRTVLHLLDALEYLEVRLPGGGRERRRLSFRALGVEQIGHVYEGLLDHTAKRASEAILGLVGKETEEPEVALAELEEKLAEGPAALADHLAGLKVSTSRQIAKWLGEPCGLERQHALQVACAGDDELYIRVLPFANLIREDSLGHLQVSPKGAMYMTAGADRRTTGTHYTPVTLTEEVVQYALEPLVYVGPAEGKPREEWVLRPAKEIVDLKVCDMAMGSGAFLVQACRYLAERLVEAWQVAAEAAARPIGFSPEGAYFTHRVAGDHPAKTAGTLVTTPLGNLAVVDPNPGQELIPADAEERLAVARRIVADRCLYGVDRNETAVEMAKLSLWLTTLQRNRPFTFLDHALRSGDSLLGVDEHQLQHLTMRWKGDDAQTGNLVDLAWVPDKLAKIKDFRQKIARIPSHDPESVRRKHQLHLGVRVQSRWLQEAADVLLLNELARLAKSPIPLEAFDAQVRALRDGPYRDDGDAEELQIARTLLGRPRFNWHLEFPDVFERGGFDAIVGNPPFLGGKRISGSLGSDYRDYLVEHISSGRRGNADLCTYFVLRASEIVRAGGTVALITTNSFCQGDSRAVGLDALAGEGFTIYRADPSRPWPGDANVEVAISWIRRGGWKGNRVLSGRSVSTISSSLDDGLTHLIPFKLRANSDLAYMGSLVLGAGFLIDEAERASLLNRNPRNEDVIRPFLGGEDVTSRNDQSPSRYCIYFADWPLDRSASGEWNNLSEGTRKQCLQTGSVPRDYPCPVAADYPECLDLVRESVKPERDKLWAGDASARDNARRWWQFCRPKTVLYDNLPPSGCAIVSSRVSARRFFHLAPPGIVFSDRLVVFLQDDLSFFGILQSTVHELWAHRPGTTTHETRPTYNPEGAFETFPMPRGQQLEVRRLESIVSKYLALRETALRNSESGLTGLYNEFHSSECPGNTIQMLREAHRELDQEVLASYGWIDITLDHAVRTVGRVTKFAPSDSVQAEILARLLKLNHERYAEEVAAGLHDEKKGGKGKKSKKATPARSAPDGALAPRRNLFDDQLVLGEADV